MATDKQNCYQSEIKNPNVSMELHQLQLALLVPDDSLLRFFRTRNKFYRAKRGIFHLGWVLPSNIGWHLIETNCRSKPDPRVSQIFFSPFPDFYINSLFESLVESIDRYCLSTNDFYSDLSEFLTGPKHALFQLGMGLLKVWRKEKERVLLRVFILL